LTAIALAVAVASFEVTGGAVPGAEGGVDVQVGLKNRGERAAAGVVVLGELGGEYAEGRLEAVEPGQTATVTLSFPSLPAPLGVHPVALRLDFSSAATGSLPAAPSSQSAYLLLTVGANPPPAVRLVPAPLALLDHDPLAVRLESADGSAHRVRVRALTPRGLTAHPEAVEVTVPAQGAATAELPLLRGGAERPSRQGVVVVAETLDGPKRTSVATAVVDVRPDPAVMPHVRRYLAGLALALALAAGIAEWRRWRHSAEAAPSA
jgi:hypothetical protein